MTVNPVTWADMDAYSRLCDEPLQPWEARAIRRVDAAFIQTVTSDGVGGSK